MDTLPGWDLRPFANRGDARQDAARHLKSGDCFQTDPAALDPLLPYLDGLRVWEPACGEGQLARRLREVGCDVEASDVQTGTDFLTCTPPRCDVILTNPPFSIKDEFIARCYALRKPWALLMPLTALEGQKRQRYYAEHGLTVVLMPRRVDFTTPSGKVGGSWFASAWYTWRLVPGEPGLVFPSFQQPAATLFVSET